MTNQTIETIRFALKFMKGVNESIYFASLSSERIKKAAEDMKKDEEAIAEFEKFVIRHAIMGANE